MQLTIMHITVFSILLPIGMGIWRYSQLDREAKRLLYMLIPVALNQFLSVWWMYYVEHNNLPFYYFFILMETLFISWIFYGYLEKVKYRWIIPLFTACFAVFFIGSFVIDTSSLRVYSTHLRSIEAFIIIFYSLLYFRNVYRKQETMYLHKTSGFWFGSGLILYFTSNLVLFMFSELIFAQETETFQWIWALHGVLTILLYLSFTIALSCKKAEIIS